MSSDSRLADPVLLALAARRCQARRQAPDWQTSVGLASLLAAAKALPRRDPWALPDLGECDGLAGLLAEARLRRGAHGA
jgi:hypothetical protein